MLGVDGAGVRLYAVVVCLVCHWTRVPEAYKRAWSCLLAMLLNQSLNAYKRESFKLLPPLLVKSSLCMFAALQAFSTLCLQLPDTFQTEGWKSLCLLVSQTAPALSKSRILDTDT